MTIWFTSDTHFGHANIIWHSGRPFKDVGEMDEQLIQNWNEVVGDRDTVIHLGDFAWRDAEVYLKRLNGSVCLVMGNHDRAARKIRTSFEWFKEVHTLRVGEQKIALSHYAHRTWNGMHRGVWHLYGHSHNSLPENIASLSFDVGVDAIAAYNAGIPAGQKLGVVQGVGLDPLAYRPISFEAVQKRMQYKRYVPEDHHA